MKIFYKKDYQRVLEVTNKMQKEIANLNVKILGYKDMESKITNSNKKLIVERDKLKEELVITEKRRRENAGKIGGLKKHINKLNTTISLKEDVIKGCKDYIKELEDKIEYLKSDAFLRKKISPGRTPNTVKTKVKMSMKPQVIKHMKNTHDYCEEV